ncbi:hypothetical protein GPL21_15920 [Bradyrhizobium pachyrhizi]|uniref:Uncharacterized protein n=1 Tax=Bradyrhizobium pachyrhizi TaxID=280333 RepID=A0A844SRS6_9BRAD|nr:hypothetical protein [Bradyrhizobium pachyrhizi]
MRSIEPQFAIANCGISRFRVWSFGPSRNDVPTNSPNCSPPPRSASRPDG